jgi:type II secretory pathway pseudopilin PulG
MKTNMMKTMKTMFGNMIRDARGVATSLIEATATVAVGAVLAGVAVGGAIDAINDSKIQAAIGDVSSIGQGVITFYKDNSFFPLYLAGNSTGSGDDYFGYLVSENGTYPTDTSIGTHWGVTTDPWTGEADFFGHKPDYIDRGHDTIEGHLIRNELGAAGVPGGGSSYPVRGSYSGDPQRGWAGPYVAVLPKTDPWGNKYMINVRELHAGHLLDPAFAGDHGIDVGSLPKMAVVVISAGPNRNIETSAEQSYDVFQAEGDDIVFRIK